VTQPGEAAMDLRRSVQSLRAEQRYVEAEQVLVAGLQRFPADPALLFGLAQTRYELGLPAAPSFAAAQQAMPGNLDIVRNRAAAMAAEGDRQGAEQLLRETLKVHPGWLDGHKGLATLLWTHGDAEHFADSYAAACRAEPANAALWIAWFGLIAQTRDWEGARRIIDEAERHIGITTPVLAARLFIACESGDNAATEAMLAATAHIQGDTTNLCRVRHAIRQQRFNEAEALLQSLTQSPAAGLYWPYRSLVWRALGDDRYHWLDRPDRFIQQSQIDLTTAELAELAQVLRSLHTMDRPYLEQTVRGGTQTDRSIMLRHEPILQRTRERWIEAIREHIATLPAFEQSQPFLGTPRNHLLLSGSWSVRLRQKGHNVPHTHPMGWLSSSLYVDIAAETELGPAPAGHIIFGRPPFELGLDLHAYRSIAPQPGMVVTFPSTTWHSVEPFAQGERLMIALDIRRPDG
jgi:tetratricopeptide (TPR) repeat protein